MWHIFVLPKIIITDTLSVHRQLDNEGVEAALEAVKVLHDWVVDRKSLGNTVLHPIYNYVSPTFIISSRLDNCTGKMLTQT